MDDIVIIKSFPLPPTENQIYGNNYVRGKRGRHKTPIAKAFEDQAHLYAAEHYIDIEMAKEKVTKWLVDRKLLFVKLHLSYPYQDIFTQNGFPKRNEPSNRVKICNDMLAKILGIDDKYFWRSCAENYLGPKRWCEIHISPITAKRIEDLAQK